VRHRFYSGIVSALAVAIVVAALPAAGRAQATPTMQAQATAKMSKDEMTALAKVQIAIGHATDSMQAQLAQARNKTNQMQTQLRESFRAQVEEILHHSGMTEAEYQRKTYLVSTDSTTRKAFDGLVAQISGVPTPGQVPAGPAPTAVPAGPVGVHIGHVINAFMDTPGGGGLLPIAMAEARTASQHATLGARTPTNLDMMKLHAGHVINALDPTIVTTGPGLGYGLKKAAEGVINHIDLAAKSAGASPNVITHANHIGTSTKNTVTRTDQLLALAKQVQDATDAAAAAALFNQMVSLSNQLIAGADANGDGRIGWQEGEGGLQQAEEHVKLMLAGEMPAKPGD
jgi:hypothetical protein